MKIWPLLLKAPKYLGFWMLADIAYVFSLFFFLNAIIDTADDGKKTFLLILELKKETDSFIISLGGRAGNANKILELFYQKPALNVKEIEKSLSMNQRTIRNVLNTLENENLIVEYTGNKRNKKYIFQRYLKLFY